MIKRIKYRLLCYLLGDICKKSTCESCKICSCNLTNVYCPCGENYIYKQARAVWGLEE